MPLRDDLCANTREVVWPTLACSVCFRPEPKFSRIREPPHRHASFYTDVFFFTDQCVVPPMQHPRGPSPDASTNHHSPRPIRGEIREAEFSPIRLPAGSFEFQTSQSEERQELATRGWFFSQHTCPSPTLTKRPLLPTDAHTSHSLLTATAHSTHTKRDSSLASACVQHNEHQCPGQQWGAGLPSHGPASRDEVRSREALAQGRG